MKWFLPAVLAFGPVLTAAEPKEELGKKELEKLQGTWVLQKLEYDDTLKDALKGLGIDKNLLEGAFKGDVLVIKDERVAINGENYSWEGPVFSATTTTLVLGSRSGGSFKIDPGQKPKTFDFMFDGFIEKKQNQPPQLWPPNFGFEAIELKGIYELDGETLKVCFGKPRPKEFATKNNKTSEQILVTLKRQTEPARERMTPKERMTLKGEKDIGRLQFVGNKTLVTFVQSEVKVWNGEVNVWDLVTQKEATLFKAPKNEPILPSTITADGKMLLTAEHYVVNIPKKFFNDGIMVLRTHDAGTGARLTTIKLDEYQWLFSPVLSADGKYIAAGGEDRSEDARKGTFRVWEAKTGKEVFKWKGESGNPIHLLAMTGDGSCVVWSSSRHNLRNNLGFVVFDKGKPKEVSLPVPCWVQAQGTDIESLNVSADGTTLAVVFKNFVHGQVAIWDLPSAKPRPRSLNTRVPLHTIAISPDGKTLATVLVRDHQDLTGSVITVWDVEKARERAVLKHTAAVEALAFSPDGKSIAAAAGPEVKIWDLPE